MHFITAKFEEKTFIGAMVNEQKFVLDLHKADEMRNNKKTIPSTFAECIEKGDEFLEMAKSIIDWAAIQEKTDAICYPAEDVAFLAPIPKPAKNVLCVGKNYRDHVIEMGTEKDIPEHIMIFTKAPTAIIGNRETIMLHEGLTQQLDYEGELAVVIGKKGRGIQPNNAMDYVFGYTIVNDITARDLQSRHKQFFLGKSLDTSCPIGPSIVHHSAIRDPHQLHIETRVNGEIRQQANTSMMIFSIPEIIAAISKGMTLEPGDIIATGTPAGVGKGFKPPKFLKSGDVVEVYVEGVGKLINTVI